MALTPEVRSTQGRVRAAIGGTPMRTTLARVYASINFPTAQLRTTQARTYVATTSGMTLRTTQARVYAAVRGRIQNPRLRAWTYTLDGHDFYVLRIGDEETFVFDLTTEQWSRFTSQDFEFWRPNYGANWRDAMKAANTYGSTVLVGDDTFGLLWFLDPDQGYDEHPDASIDVDLPFPRAATGQMIARGRQYIGCYAVWLTASGGFPAYPNATVTLSYSDDAGNNYNSAGPITVESGNYNQDLVWYSLGKYTYPGRLYRIEDDGALARIDSMDVDIGSDDSLGH